MERHSCRDTELARHELAKMTGEVHDREKPPGYPWSTTFSLDHRRRVSGSATVPGQGAASGSFRSLKWACAGVLNAGFVKRANCWPDGDSNARTALCDPQVRSSRFGSGIGGNGQPRCFGIRNDRVDGRAEYQARHPPAPIGGARPACIVAAHLLHRVKGIAVSVERARTGTRLYLAWKQSPIPQPQVVSASEASGYNTLV